MSILTELKKQIEVDFLKTKTYEEINDMFNELNDKLIATRKELYEKIQELTELKDKMI